MHPEVLKRLSRGDTAALQSLEAIQQETLRLASLLPAAFSVMALELSQRAPVDLGALVRRVVGAEHAGRVRVVQGAWPTILGDERLLGSAVGHLIRNAPAGPGRRPPELSFRSVDGGRAALVVRDWGAGLRTTNPRSLIRLALSPKSGRPTLGLVTVERIARLHGGALIFANPPEGGADVSLLLPVG
jgi:signal transduction histidine kinase